MKLRGELSALKKSNEQSSNPSQVPSSGNTTSVSKQPGDDKDAQLKSVQKRLRDTQVELKGKKEKLEEQDQIIKKLQERLQAKLDEVQTEQKKNKDLEGKLARLEEKLSFVRKGSQWAKELEAAVMRAKVGGKSWAWACENIGELIQNPSVKAEITKQNKDTIELIVPKYDLIPQSQVQKLTQNALQELCVYKTSLKEALDPETKLTMDEFKEVLATLEIWLS